MNTELTKHLKEKYPKLFSELEWGFECGDGWYWLIDKISAAIEGASHDMDAKVVQVKNKFGGLRYYVIISSATDLEKAHDTMRTFAGITLLGEHLSFSTCEHCGETKGTVVDSTPFSLWVECLCPKCRDDRIANEETKLKSLIGPRDDL